MVADLLQVWWNSRSARLHWKCGATFSGDACDADLYGVQKFHISEARFRPGC